MAEDVDWERFSDPTIVSAKHMIIICLVIEIILQSFVIMIHPTEWWIWQLLGFITAVILAIMSARSANDIGKAYKSVFTPSFYKTMRLISQFQEYFEEEATKEGRDLDAEVRELSPKIWALIKARLDVSDTLEPLVAFDKESEDDLF